MKLGKIIVLSAASGAGKTTLKDRVLPLFPDLIYSISATTRPPRTGEKNGIHYFFKTREQFEKMIAKGALAEYNEVHGNYYGTPRNFLDHSLEKGMSVLMDLDVYGKTNFDKVYPEAIGIFIRTPNTEELEKRLRHRATDSEEVIQLRLSNAVKEMEYAKQKGKYEYTLINDDFDRAARELEEIIRSILESTQDEEDDEDEVQDF